MKLYNILKKCNTVFTIINPQNFDISGLTYDSRCVKNNFIVSKSRKECKEGWQHEHENKRTQ